MGVESISRRDFLLKVLPMTGLTVAGVSACAPESRSETQPDEQVTIEAGEIAATATVAPTVVETAVILAEETRESPGTAVHQTPEIDGGEELVIEETVDPRERRFDFERLMTNEGREILNRVPRIETQIIEGKERVVIGGVGVMVAWEDVWTRGRWYGVSRLGVEITPKIVVLHYDGSSEDPQRGLVTDNGLRSLVHTAESLKRMGRGVQVCVDSNLDARGVMLTGYQYNEAGGLISKDMIHAGGRLMDGNTANWLRDWQAVLGERFTPGLMELVDLTVTNPYDEWNLYAVGVEGVGERWELSHMPHPQTAANELGVVIWMMKRYQIPLYQVVGHNEIQDGKYDVGDEFMALTRFLIVLYAYKENDSELKALLPADMQNMGSEEEVVERYWTSDMGVYSQRRLRGRLQRVEEYALV